MRSVQGRFKVVPAVYVIFWDGDRVLLLRRADTGYHDGEYSLPAGHVGGADEQGGEPATEAAIREAKEEVGVDIVPQDLRLVHTMHRRSDDPELHERIDLVFEVRSWHGKLKNAEPHKCDELRWAAVADLPKNMVPEVRQLLQKVASHESYSDFNF